MLPGETIMSGADDHCCGVKLEFKPLKSNAGWYVGTFCPKCGPYSRESHYYNTEEEVRLAMATQTVRWRT